MTKKITLQDKKKMRETIKEALMQVYCLNAKKLETDSQKKFLDLAVEKVYSELNKKE